MNEKQTHYDWAFGLQWMITCAVGMLLLGLVAFLSMWSIGEVILGRTGETPAWVVMGLLFGTLFALGAAIGPGMLLRGKGIDVTKWIAYSAVAGAIGAASGFVLFFTFLDPDTVPEILTSLILGLFIGLPMGIAQWLVLRKGGEGTTIWPVIVTTAFVAGFTIGIPLGEDGQEWISLSAIGLFAGAITALGAVWLLGSKQTAVSA